MTFEGAPQFKPKTETELEKQVQEAIQTSHLLIPDEIRNKLFTTPESELKESYPDEYQAYIEALRHIKKNNNEINPVIYSRDELGALHWGLNGEPISEELRKKIELDPYIREYSAVVLFPGIYERVYEKKELPKISSFGSGTRRSVVKVAFTDIAYMVKPIENNKETGIARRMAELGVGPRQYNSLIGYLTEEFIEGETIAKLSESKATKEYMEMLGHKIGLALRKIHAEGYIVNDQLLVDDFGKSHTIITPEDEIRFIDFGATVNVNNFPHLDDVDVFNFMRTDPQMMLHLAFKGILSFEQVPKEELEQYRRFLAYNKSIKNLVETRDGALLREGALFLSHSLPNVSTLMEAIKKELIAQ